MNSERKKLPDGWKWAKLGDVCIRHKNTDPRRDPDKQFIYIDISSIDRSAKTILNPSVIFGKEAPSRAKRIVNKGDVLVSTTRPNLNAVALVHEDLDGQICSTGLCVLRPKTHLLDSRWLYYCAMSREFVSSLSNLVSGAMYPAVTDKQVFEQAIPLPSLEEQKGLAAVLDERMAAVEEARKAAEEMIDAVDALKNAILRELLP